MLFLKRQHVFFHEKRSVMVELNPPFSMFLAFIYDHSKINGYGELLCLVLKGNFVFEGETNILGINSF